MDFQLSKQNALTKKDKSHEQKWDNKIKLLCGKINQQHNLYTTSSCSGRIIIIPDTNQKLKQGFLYKTHSITTLQEVKNTLSSVRENPRESEAKNNNPSTHLWLRMEPAALHIACKELEQAQKILTKARNLGWKKSGIISIKGRYIIELFAPELVITPIVPNLPKEYLELLITEANKKLEQTWTKIKKLELIF